ncbi:hypothetical protein SAMN03159512_01841 [Pseudomonas sp. NFR09]|uniref:hypothetical protein n=1 Tax=Pseudomonas sp. NFR09 TaxID=1566249 RepID=UPI0008BFD4DE|nr:hypothetical protein [Pseudomonas sp. NFR09]SET28080.1 hypothetical protein SAMN03159512_01841 [Pseudomonas sp. NFR09]
MSDSQVITVPRDEVERIVKLLNEAREWLINVAPKEVWTPAYKSLIDRLDKELALPNRTVEK